MDCHAMKISTHQLEAFTLAARTRSFSEAARILGVTQSAITQHVANLERLIGAQLFVRRREGLELTKPAQELFALSDRLRTIEQVIAEKIESYGTLATGHLQIIANAPRPSLPLIAQYRQVYPNVGLSFGLCSWTSALEKIKKREVDIAVITHPEGVEGMFTLELARTKYLAHMHKSHPLASKKEICLADLREETVILPEQGSLTQSVVAEHIKKANVKLDRAIEMATFPVIKEAILHNIGIGILLDDSFHPTQQLVKRPIKELDFVYRTYLVTQNDKKNLRFIRSFIEIAEQVIATAD
jgi:LysR family transcriptional regulator, low CO2-responsive transcriptional regulator